MSRDKLYDLLNDQQGGPNSFQYNNSGFKPRAEQNMPPQQEFPQQFYPNEQNFAGQNQFINNQNFNNFPTQEQYNNPSNFQNNSQQGKGFPANQNPQSFPVGAEDVFKKIQANVHEYLNTYMSNVKSDSMDEQFMYSTMEQYCVKKREAFMQEYGIDIELHKEQIIKNILNVILGLGPLEAFLKDPEITEIICCSFDNIWVEKKGKMMKTSVEFSSEKEFRNIIDSKILQPLGRRVDDAQPLVNARLADKSRVNVVINPIAADGATLDIRKFRETKFTIPEYVQLGSMRQVMGDFLKYAVKYKKNVIVSGGTGSGKTTLLNCLSSFIPENEAIVTIEDTLELQLVQPCLRRLEARAANAEGTGAVTIRDCLVNALRMRPDRIIVGECRSSEVVDMLQAMNTGHDGSLTTVHANTPKDMIERVTSMYFMAGIGDVPEKSIKFQIAAAIHIIVQVARLPSGERKVMQITEIVGVGKNGAEENNEYVRLKGLPSKFEVKVQNVGPTDIVLQDIFKYDVKTKKFFATGWVPTFWDEIEASDKSANISIFKEGEI